jgi:membrane dipeptidase
MVVDLHEDIAYHYMSGGQGDIRPFDQDMKGRHVDIPKYKKVGMKLILGSVYPLLDTLNLRKIAAMKRVYGVWAPSATVVSPRDVAIELIKIYYSLEEMHPSALKIVRTKEDIESLGERTGIIMHIEGCEALGEPEDLRVFYNLGVRSIGLTWNYDNKYAASCLSTKDYGLTGEGEALVSLANRLGVMVDLSHTSPRTSSDTLEVSESSPFFSHSDALAVQVSKRNISDALIRKTGKRGGIVGLTFIRSCIGKPFTPARIAEHARHMIKVGGETLPALGTDYLGMSSTPEGLEDLSKLGRLRRALKKSGIPPNLVQGILNDNAYKFILSRSERW